MGTEAGKLKKTAAAAGVAAFWLLVWQLLAMLIGKDVVLSPPLTVFRTLVRLMGTGEFWLTVGATFLRILFGYGFGAALGLGLGLAAWKSGIVRRLLAPFMSVVRATPVASFIILLLFLARNQWIPVLIAALMVMPLIWANCLKGIEETDRGLLEMGQVFELSRRWQIRHIYGPSVRAFFLPAAVTGLGLAWKAGVAAEVLAAPEHSVGGMLYRAKIYLENPEMLAWTLCVILISLALETLLKRLLQKTNG
ncbi:MAG: ABC transporter permease subunit [Lachnospiraceae bacterium]|nr:ABC transporter permease subunit [Lachnospiraceae bacterium]